MPTFVSEFSMFIANTKKKTNLLIKTILFQTLTFFLANCMHYAVLLFLQSLNVRFIFLAYIYHICGKFEQIDIDHFSIIGGNYQYNTIQIIYSNFKIIRRHFTLIPAKYCINYNYLIN